MEETEPLRTKKFPLCFRLLGWFPVTCNQKIHVQYVYILALCIHVSVSIYAYVSISIIFIFMFMSIHTCGFI